MQPVYKRGFISRQHPQPIFGHQWPRVQRALHCPGSPAVTGRRAGGASHPLSGPGSLGKPTLPSQISSSRTLSRPSLHGADAPQCFLRARALEDASRFLQHFPQRPPGLEAAQPLPGAAASLADVLRVSPARPERLRPGSLPGLCPLQSVSDRSCR